MLGVTGVHYIQVVCLPHGLPVDVLSSLFCAPLLHSNNSTLPSYELLVHGVLILCQSVPNIEETLTCHQCCSNMPKNAKQRETGHQYCGNPSFGSGPENFMASHSTEGILEGGISSLVFLEKFSRNFQPQENVRGTLTIEPPKSMNIQSFSVSEHVKYNFNSFFLAKIYYRWSLFLEAQNSSRTNILPMLVISPWYSLRYQTGKEWKYFVKWNSLSQPSSVGRWRKKCQRTDANMGPNFCNAPSVTYKENQEHEKKKKKILEVKWDQ